jgi:hypothetical protein
MNHISSKLAQALYIYNYLLVVLLKIMKLNNICQVHSEALKYYSVYKSNRTSNLYCAVCVSKGNT